MIADDSADTTAEVETGNFYALSEKRVGFAEEVEVGIISGLGMSASGTQGRIEFEGVEVAQVLLGNTPLATDEGSIFTIGGEGFLLDAEEAAGGTADALMLTTTELTKGRLAEGSGPGFTTNLETFSGMTIVEGGSGIDDIRFLSTRDLDGPPESSIEDASDRVVVTTLTEGDRATATSERVRIDLKADVGYFVLEFADQDLDPTTVGGDNTVPGAEQTVVLPYNLTGTDGETALKNALGALRLVGGTDFILSVTEQVTPTAGAKRSFVVEFKSDLDNLPELLAFDTRLLGPGIVRIGRAQAVEV